MSKANEKFNLVVAKDQSVQVNGTNIRLNLIEGWDDLSEPQQQYLEHFASDPNRKTIHAMQLGLSTGQVDKWFTQQEFSEVANTINRIYTEELKSIDFQEAVDNSKTRSRVIKARENDGQYTEKKEGSKHLHINGGDNLGDLLKMLGD